MNAHFLNPGLSDHCPLLYDLGQDSAGSHRPFRFFNSVVEHEQFYDRVKEAWQQDIQGTAMYKVWEKLKAVKGIAKQIHKLQWQ